VFKILETHKEYREAVWVNATEETGVPFDITAIYDNCKVVIEVKTSVDFNKPLVHVSAAEVQEAYRHHKNYHLFLLFVSKSQRKLVRIIFPTAHLQLFWQVSINQ